MAEEVSPESKLYVKEEIEKSRKEFKEDLQDARSRATKTFTTVALIVGLLTGLGVVGSVIYYMSTTTIAKLESEAERSRDNIVRYEGEAKDILSYKVIIGTIVPYGGEIEEEKHMEPIEVGEGWFFCNGAPLNRKDHEELYEVIRNSFGAPNDDTFNLPDLRGRFVRGVDHGTKRDPDASNRESSNNGGKIGNKVGSCQLDNIQTHTHQWGVYNPTDADLYSWDKYLKPVKALDRGKHNQIPGGSSKDDDFMDVVNNDFWTNPQTCVEISGTETRPKNVYVNWIIKAK
jgi:hypothetical protein